MKILFLRTLTGAVYVGIILLSILVHPVGFKVMTLAMNIIAILEFKRIGQKMGVVFTPSWLLLNISLMMCELILMQMGVINSFGIIPFIVFVIAVLTISLYQRKGNPFIGAAFSILSIAFITLPLLLLNIIHNISVSQSIPYTLAIFIFIWINDTFAYLSGMALGRHRLFERISPKKSWEGFFGGILMVILSAFVFYRFSPSPGLTEWIIFGMLAALASVFGDFNESLLKRVAEIKDSGNILPGHGGMLDRIDSLLLASPVIYIYLLLI
jgi:phosphatidate cytidylyltransferase